MSEHPALRLFFDAGANLEIEMFHRCLGLRNTYSTAVQREQRGGEGGAG